MACDEECSLVEVNGDSNNDSERGCITVMEEMCGDVSRQECATVDEKICEPIPEEICDENVPYDNTGNQTRWDLFTFLFTLI